jgi:hypothetical protein
MIVGEESRYADDARDSDQGIDDPGDHDREVVKDEGDKVEIEEADKSPIQCADDDDD